MARILVVDDQVGVRAAIRAMLENKGHTVVVAEGGHTAAGAIEAFAFDVALVDIIMPGLNGLDTIKLFRESAPDVPIIAMTGYAFQGGSSDRDLLQVATELGAACCLQKPFKPQELVSAIERCLGVAVQNPASVPPRVRHADV